MNDEQREQIRQELYRLADQIADTAETINVQRHLGHEMRDNYQTGMRYLRRTGEHTVTITWDDGKADPYEDGDPVNRPALMRG